MQIREEWEYKPGFSTAPSNSGNTFNKARHQGSCGQARLFCKGYRENMSSSFTAVTRHAGFSGLCNLCSLEPWNSVRSHSVTVNSECWYGTRAGPRRLGSPPSALPDLLPGLGGQMQDPEILVVVKLLSVGRSKLSPEDPQLPAALRHHYSLWKQRLTGQSTAKQLSAASTSGDQGLHCPPEHGTW